MKLPSCYNRSPFKGYVYVQNGWTEDGRRDMVCLEDNMTKRCHQHDAPFGEAYLGRLECGDCCWKPNN